MPTGILFIRTLSAGTQIPVPGASVYVNGSFVGTTDTASSTLTLSPTTPAGAGLRVTASGFQDAVGMQAGIVYLNPLVSVANTPVAFVLNVYPATPLATYQFTSQATGAMVTGPAAASTNSVQLVPGIHNLLVSAAGFADNASLVTASDGSATVQMVKLSDPNSTGIPTGNAMTVLADSTSTPIVPYTLLPKPEFVAPTSSYGRYFMANDARMYIGNLFIDELDYIQYALQDNKVPIYPYMSRYFAALAQGRSLIQGQLGINFISEGYLYTVLKNYFDTFSSDPTDPVAIQQTELNNLVAQQSLLAKPSYALSNSQQDSIVKADDGVQLTDIANRVQDLVSSLGPASLDTAKNYLARTVLPDYNATDVGFCNAVYQSGPFDIEIDFSGGQRTAIRRLEACFLISNEQILSRDGKTLIDSYGFICRRLR